MNWTKDTEYIFWLNGWRDQSRVFANIGQFKCIITKTEIRIISLDDDRSKEKTIAISSVRDIKIEYPINSIKHFVKVILGDGHTIFFLYIRLTPGIFCIPITMRQFVC
jgi:hypothetical protein